MEHVERQEEREAELRSDADQLERQGDELEQKGEQLDERISDVRSEVEQKKHSEDVPGLQDENQLSDGPPPEADITPGDEE